jgi:hypothetical protein
MMNLPCCSLILLLTTFAQSQVPLGMDSFVKNLKPVHASLDFSDKTTRAAWTPANLYEPPAGKRLLLGRFHSGDTAQLTVNNLPRHRALLIHIEIVILCHWDGYWMEYGPDTWSASLRDGPTLLATTFSNFQQAFQNFPDEAGAGYHPYQSGSRSVGDYDFVKEMGERGKRWQNLDATYHLWLAVEHKDPSATMEFSGKFHDTPDGEVLVGESWAIAASQVWAIDPALHPAPEALAAALTSLTDAEEIPANDMIATLVLAGENGLSELEKHLREKQHKELLPPSLVGTAPLPWEKIIDNLSDPHFKTRKAASGELLTHIPRHRNELLDLLRSHPEPETRIRIQQALAAHDAPASDEEQRILAEKEFIAARLKHVLRLMSGLKASQWLSHLQSPSNTDR